jgi:hypothetical protein
VQSRIAMLDISALAFGLLAIAAFICCPGDLYRHRRRDPPDAKLAVLPTMR